MLLLCIGSGGLLLRYDRGIVRLSLLHGRHHCGMNRGRAAEQGKADVKNADIRLPLREKR